MQKPLNATCVKNVTTILSELLSVHSLRPSCSCASNPQPQPIGRSHFPLPAKASKFTELNRMKFLSFMILKRFLTEQKTEECDEMDEPVVVSVAGKRKRRQLHNSAVLVLLLHLNKHTRTHSYICITHIVNYVKKKKKIVGVISNMHIKKV